MSRKTKKHQQQVSAHHQGLIDLGYVVIIWSPEDMPGKTKAMREKQLDEVSKSLVDRSIEFGHDVIETLLG